MGTNQVKMWTQTSNDGERLRRSRITAPQVFFQTQIPALHLPLIGSWVSFTPRGNVIAITAVLFHQPAACWGAVEPGLQSDAVCIRSSKKQLRAACWVHGRKSIRRALADVLMLSEGWWPTIITLHVRLFTTELLICKGGLIVLLTRVWKKVLCVSCRWETEDKRLFSRSTSR